VTLTDEEQRECQAFVSSVIPQSDGGRWVIKEELHEPFTRNLVAMCMMGRAERFAILAESGGSEYRKKACEAAAKACAIYPLSAYIYDFACILDRLGDEEDARAAFAEFLRRNDAGPQNEVDRFMLSQRDVTTMVARAKGKTGIR
jgi:hypothetical protein